MRRRCKPRPGARQQADQTKPAFSDAAYVAIGSAALAGGAGQPFRTAKALTRLERF